jgi:hypothetical protein
MCETCGGLCGLDPDTLLRCSTSPCEREVRVEYDAIAAGGWPGCHGHPMTLVRTAADLSAAGGLQEQARFAARGACA